MTIQQQIQELSRIFAGIYRHSEEDDPALDKQLEIAKQLFNDFNKKYPKLFIKIQQTIDQCHVDLYINEESVQTVFDVASKIKGLAAIGHHGFEEASVQDPKFQQLAQGFHANAFLTYQIEGGSETIVLHYVDKEKKVRLNYEIKSLSNPLSPQFQLVQEYMKEQGEDNELLEKMYALGFTDISDDALFEWEDDFYPKMLE